MCGSTARPHAPLDSLGSAPGDRIRCRCWPSFCDNIVMRQDSWQLCFLSARIFCDINSKCHSGAVSTAAQQTHDTILMCTLILLPFFFLLPLNSFYLPQFILIRSLLRPLSLSLLSFICVTLHINLLLPHKCVCPNF